MFLWLWSVRCGLESVYCGTGTGIKIRSYHWWFVTCFKSSFPFLSSSGPWLYVATWTTDKSRPYKEYRLFPLLVCLMPLLGAVTYCSVLVGRSYVWSVRYVTLAERLAEFTSLALTRRPGLERKWSTCHSHRHSCIVCLFWLAGGVQWSPCSQQHKPPLPSSLA